MHQWDRSKWEKVERGLKNLQERVALALKELEACIQAMERMEDEAFSGELRQLRQIHQKLMEKDCRIFELRRRLQTYLLEHWSADRSGQERDPAGEALMDEALELLPELKKPEPEDIPDKKAAEKCGEDHGASGEEPAGKKEAFCRHCGAKLHSGLHFCTRCGALVGAGDAGRQSEK